MAEIRWTPQAATDLESIAVLITRDSQNYARLFVIDVFDAINRIRAFPNLGRIVPEIKNPLIREVILGNYRIVYRIQSRTIEILTIYHAARLLDPAQWG